MACNGLILAFIIMAGYILHLKLGEIRDTLSQMATYIGSLEIPDTQELSVEGIREDIMDLMQDMRPPTIVDHLGGALAQILQAKAMSQMQQLQPEHHIADAIHGD